MSLVPVTPQNGRLQVPIEYFDIAICLLLRKTPEAEPNVLAENVSLEIYMEYHQMHPNVPVNIYLEDGKVYSM